jgi:hypothetical protein
VSWQNPSHVNRGIIHSKQEETDYISMIHMLG